MTTVSQGPQPTPVPGPVTDRKTMGGRRRHLAGVGENAGKANWIVKAVLLTICFLWIVPVIGLFITSVREPDAANATGWWTVLKSPLDVTQWTLANYTEVATESNMFRAFINSFWLMIILIWAQVGFSMVLLSAAVKSVPTETLEAARIDGANERQAFFRVVVPQIWPTVITVFITVLIGVMKVFDIVYVMTNGNFNTNVIGLDFYNQLFTNGNAGYAAAIVVLLMVAIIPVMIYQVRQFRAQEAAR